ncbi:alpha/beta fold hydrolase [Saccharomonospora sp. NPDC046836]|uniref:alpha/beta fold hydrolase n=1 Tax=Saccharomonospora sp. NPDC046836 TaxID=3156921 RepID=UPI0033E4B413
MTIASDHVVGNRIRAAGIDTYYLDSGTGEPVVLLHGSGPGVSAWANWMHTIPGLAKRFRVLAPELVGYGSTERPADIRYGVRTWVDHALGFLDALELPRVSIVGNSMGGLVALHIAQRSPDRLNRMVLMGAPGIGMVPTEGLAALRAYEPSPRAMRELMTNYFAFDPSIVTDDLVHARYQASAAPGVQETYRAMFHDPRHTGDNLVLDEDRVRGVQTPTLIVHGRDDKIIPVEVGWTMAGLLPQARLHVFPRCGHWAQIEWAAEFVNLISDFLGGADPTAARDPERDPKEEN